LTIGAVDVGQKLIVPILALSNKIDILFYAANLLPLIKAGFFNGIHDPLYACVDILECWNKAPFGRLQLVNLLKNERVSDCRLSQDHAITIRLSDNITPMLRGI
jgi:hypothetical protein